MFSGKPKWRGVISDDITVFLVSLACVAISSALLGTAISNNGGDDGSSKEATAVCKNAKTEDLKQSLAFQVFLGQAIMHFLACYSALVPVVRTRSFCLGKGSLFSNLNIAFFSCLFVSVCTGIATPIVYSTVARNKDASAVLLNFISRVFSAMATGLLALRITKST